LSPNGHGGSKILAGTDRNLPLVILTVGQVDSYQFAPRSLLKRQSEADAVRPGIATERLTLSSFPGAPEIDKGNAAEKD
jgi:hypothetical protein